MPDETPRQAAPGKSSCQERSVAQPRFFVLEPELGDATPTVSGAVAVAAAAAAAAALGNCLEERRSRVIDAAR